TPVSIRPRDRPSRHHRRSSPTSRRSTVPPSSPTRSRYWTSTRAPTGTGRPYVGDELHHFGWNACSSALCPYAPHPHVERRYLVVPGLRSSRLYVIDTKPDPSSPRI